MKSKINKDTIFFVIVSIFAALIVGFRGSTPDTQDYYDVFKNISTLPLLNPYQFYQDTGMEIGFGWFAYIVNLFTSSGVVMFTIFSLLNFYLIYRTTKYLDINFIYSIVFYITSSYFIMMQFMQMRQGLAVSLVIFTVVSAIKNGLKFNQLLLILLAVSLHQSTIFLIIFCLIFYFLRNKKIFSANNQKLTNWSLFIIFIVIFKFWLLNLLINLSGRLQSYANSNTFNEAVELFSPPNIRTFLILILLTYFSSENLNKNIYFRLFLFLMFIALSIRIGFSDFGIMSGRLSTAFSYVEIFALSMLLFDRFKVRARTAILILFALLQLFITLHFQAPYLLEMYFNPLYSY
ncbi:MAG: EpsG family protein [Alphaproteobacteria bacterium]